MSKRGGACCSLAERMPGARRLPFSAHQPVRDLLARHGPSSGTSPSFFPSPLFPPSLVPDLDPPSLACLSIDDTLFYPTRSSSLISGTRACHCHERNVETFLAFQISAISTQRRQVEDSLSNRVQRLCRERKRRKVLWVRLCRGFVIWIFFLNESVLCVCKIHIDRII